MLISLTLMLLEQYCTFYPLWSMSHHIPRTTPASFLNYIHLHVLAHHGNHEIEQSDGLNESEAENGVGEELTSHAWVASNSGEESSENHADTDTGTSETNGSRTHTQVLGDLDHGGSDLRVEVADGLASHDVTGSGIKDLGGLLTLHGLERSI